MPWGEQSWDEMLYGTVVYREMTTTAAAQVSSIATVLNTVEDAQADRDAHRAR